MSDRVRFLIACCALAMIGTSAFAEGQGVRDRDPSIAAERALVSELQTSTFHRGAWYLLSRLELSDIGVDEDYYAPTRDQTTGFSLSLRAPQTLYYVPSKKVILTAKVSPAYSWVQKTGRHSQFGYLARADAHFLLNYLYLDLYHEENSALRANTGELNSLLTLRDQVTGLNSIIKYSSRTSATLAGYYRAAAYPISQAQPNNVDIAQLDRNEYVGRVSLLHRTFPLTSLSLIGEGRRYNFSRAAGRNARRSFAGVGASYSGGRATISAEAGFGQLAFSDSTHRPFRGVIGSLSARRHLPRRWEAIGSAVRDLDFSLFANNDYYVTDRAGMALQFSATRRLSLTAASDYGRNRYDVPFQGVLRRDSYSFTRVGWLYNLRRISAGFDVGYYRRSSNVEEGQHGIRTVLHLSLTP